jgi:hypothetical protein
MHRVDYDSQVACAETGADAALCGTHSVTQEQTETEATNGLDGTKARDSVVAQLATL